MVLTWICKGMGKYDPYFWEINVDPEALEQNDHHILGAKGNIMLSLAAMRQLRDAYHPHRPLSEKAVFDRVGNPTPDEIIETALAGLKSEDRNVRVLMLRVLKGQTGEKAMR